MVTGLDVLFDDQILIGNFKMKVENLNKPGVIFYHLFR